MLLSLIGSFAVTPSGAAASPPATMSAPTLTGGTEEATLTLATPAPSDGGDTITSYGYEVTTAVDTGFASPLASGTQTPGNLGNPINISPLTADDYIARSRATNSIGSGAWSAASAAATVTAASAPSITANIVGSTLEVNSSAAGDLHLTLVPDIEATPSETQIIAGKKSDGSPAPFTYTAAITTGDQSLSPDISGVSDGDYKFCILVQDGGGTNSNVVVIVETISTPLVVVDEGSSTGTFTSSGGFRIWEAAPGDTLVVSSNADFNAVLVGDGGDGGNRDGGGGGAGEYVRREIGTNPLALTTGSYTVSKSVVASDRGQDWTFAGLTAIGGGNGGTRTGTDAGTGGSGGGARRFVNSGAASIAVDGIGFAGAGQNNNTSAGGGGGSATETPPIGGSNEGGRGGHGIPSPVPGETGVGYAAGGGAGGLADGSQGVGGDFGGGDGAATSISAQAGASGTGSGGGGGSDSIRTGASGGTGTLKVWWPE